MDGKREIDTAFVWRRAGLETLREALAVVRRLAAEFEQMLAVLPPCNDCARNQLLEQIRRSGERLSGEALSLAVLTETLKQATDAASAAQAGLLSQPPTPCECPSGTCTCH